MTEPVCRSYGRSRLNIRTHPFFVIPKSKFLWGISSAKGPSNASLLQLFTWFSPLPKNFLNSSWGFKKKKGRVEGGRGKKIGKLSFKLVFCSPN